MWECKDRQGPIRASDVSMGSMAQCQYELRYLFLHISPCQSHGQIRIDKIHGCEAWFGSLPRCSYTLLQCSWGVSWGQQSDALPLGKKFGVGLSIFEGTSFFWSFSNRNPKAPHVKSSAEARSWVSSCGPVPAVLAVALPERDTFGFDFLRGRGAKALASWPADCTEDDVHCYFQRCPWPRCGCGGGILPNGAGAAARFTLELSCAIHDVYSHNCPIR